MALKVQESLGERTGKRQHLLEEDSDDIEVKVLIQNVNKSINRLNDFPKKLEDTDIQIATIVDGQDGENEISELIDADWDYISTVMDCRDDLITLLSSLGEQGSPKVRRGNVSRDHFYRYTARWRSLSRRAS